MPERNPLELREHPKDVGQAVVDAQQDENPTGDAASPLLEGDKPPGLFSCILAQRVSPSLFPVVIFLVLMAQPK